MHLSLFFPFCYGRGEEWFGDDDFLESGLRATIRPKIMHENGIFEAMQLIQTRSRERVWISCCR